MSTSYFPNIMVQPLDDDFEYLSWLKATSDKQAERDAWLTKITVYLFVPLAECG